MVAVFVLYILKVFNTADELQRTSHTNASDRISQPKVVAGRAVDLYVFVYVLLKAKHMTFMLFV